ncbi:MAG TPA: HlyD family secretion protein [Allosphingosinicella sp.]|jgi:membrane fusion protein (multidrug efflux system)
MAELALIERRSDSEAARAADPAPPADVKAPAAPGSRKKRALAGGLGLLLIAGGALGYQYQAVWAHQESTDNAYVRADITSVAARLEGYVSDLKVTDNQRVKAGDVLMVIDPADAQAKLARAEAELATAEAQLATLGAASRTAQAQLGAQGGTIGQAAARLSATRATAARASADETRFAALAEKGWATKARLDQVRAEAQSARADIAASEAALAAERGRSAALSAGTAGAEAEIVAGRARVQAARAALQSARLELGRTVVRAPVDGVVGNRAVRQGQLVRPGQQLLAIVPMQAAYVVANFKETQVGKMRVHQPVTVEVDAYPGMEIKGRIESLAPASGAQFALIPTDSATGNFTKIVQRVPVKISVAPDALAAQLLRPGLSVEATVDTRD